MEYFALVMFACVCLVLLSGVPVAFALSGTALIFAGIAVAIGELNFIQLKITFLRLEGILNNFTLMAVPLFVFMGVMLERAKIAENLLDSMSALFGNFKGGLAISVTLVGMLLAASTGIVGATVVTMGLLSLPVMLKRGYDPKLATGIICASGTLGQIIPPSIVLVLLGDVIASAYREADTSADPISVGDLFAGALIPGLLLVVMYIIYIVVICQVNPKAAPASNNEQNRPAVSEIIKSLLLPLLLIFFVLGSILSGLATPTEAAAVGAVGAMGLAILRREFNLQKLNDVMASTLKTTAMVFMILIGASIFSAVFRVFGGDDLVHGLFEAMPGGVFGAMVLVMIIMFLLGFILDFIEITFVIVPLVAPVLLKMGVDPLWLGVMIAINLQTSFLTPPFGFALFYLRGVAPEGVSTQTIYRGVIPFIGIQVLALIILAVWPGLITWLPRAF